MNLSEELSKVRTEADVKALQEKLKRTKCSFERIAGRIRSVESLASEIERYDLTTIQSSQQLLYHVMKNWTCREVDFFSSFLHGGLFVPSSGKWRRESSGITTNTAQEDTNLSNVWRQLIFLTYAYIGAAAVLGIKNSCVKPGLMLTDEGDGLTPWDMTIGELQTIIPEEQKKRLDLVARLNQFRDELVSEVKDALSMPLPAASDYVVSTAQLSGMLERCDAKAGPRTIQLWEQYLRTGGKKGSKPPMNYNLHTRLTLETATAWVRSYSAAKKSRLRTKISYEALKGGRI